MKNNILLFRNIELVENELVTNSDRFGFSTVAKFATFQTKCDHDG